MKREPPGKEGRKLKRIRLPDVIGTNEREALLNAPSPTSMLGIRARAILGLMARNGLRVSEVCALTTTDLRLDVDDPYVRVIGKGDKERRAFVGPGMKEALRDWLRMRPKNIRGKALFPVVRSGRRGQGVSKVGRAISRQTVGAMVKHFAAKAGIRSIHPHTLRHTFATLALRDGENLRRVQEALGHAHVSQTQIYTHLAGGELADMAQRLDPGKH